MSFSSLFHLETFTVLLLIRFVKKKHHAKEFAIFECEKVIALDCIKQVERVNFFSTPASCRRQH